MYKKLDVILISALVVSLIFSPAANFAAKSARVRENVLRLHILANSDSVADQSLKISVRDTVLKEMEKLAADATTIDDAIKAAEEGLEKIEQAARQTVISEGFEYDINAQLVNMYFETKSYGDTVFPAGFYDALRITVGEGKGKNWWCVMFPPLCVSAACAPLPTDAQTLIDELNASEGRLKLAFAGVELFEELLFYFRAGKNRSELRYTQG